MGRAGAAPQPLMSLDLAPAARDQSLPRRAGGVRKPARQKGSWQATLRAGPALRVAARDNGPGLTAEQKEKVRRRRPDWDAEWPGLGRISARRLGGAA